MEKWTHGGEDDREATRKIIEFFKKMSKNLLDCTKPSKGERKRQPKIFVPPEDRVNKQIESSKIKRKVKLPIGSRLALPFWSQVLLQEDPDPQK
ncbi:hypothetical protein CN03_02950 [Thalassolituus oleivorans]|nr:hypothetical protein CN03_02950 [Thalassolituus oleivorans]